MNFSWLAVLIFALFAVVVDGSCPAKFQAQNGICVAERPIHGECPAGSTYKLNVNGCVYGA